MSLLSETMPATQQYNTVAFNTGTLFDLATGGFDQGKDGHLYLTGGLGCQFNSIVGKNGNFKSTIAAGLITRAAAIYQDSGLMIYDTENSISQDKERIEAMPEELRSRLNPEDIVWISSSQYSLEELDELILQHCQNKSERIKDFTIETPFLDRNNQPIKQVIPTFLLVDSFTEAYCDKEDEMLNDMKSGKSGMGDSASNTIYMKDGNKKTLWTRVMRRRCEQYGIVLVITGHYDQKMAMDMYHPNPKETVFGKQDWVVKGVGSKFKFLSSIYARTEAQLLIDANKEALYPNGATAPKDIFEVDMYIDRCKSMQAGTCTPFVCSQSTGLLNAATYYNFIRNNEYYGCNGSKQKQQLKLLPDVTLSRGTIRQLAEANEHVRRALEITAHFCFIKNSYVNKLPYDLNKDPLNLFDYLMSDKNKDLKQEILNSRSYWSYKKEDKPYMSVFDILNRVK